MMAKILHQILVDRRVKSAEASICRYCPEKGPCPVGRAAGHSIVQCELPIDPQKATAVIARRMKTPPLWHAS